MEILTPQYHDTPFNSKLSKLLCVVPVDSDVGFRQSSKIDSIWSILPKVVQSYQPPSLMPPHQLALNAHGWQAFINTIRAHFTPITVSLDFELEGTLKRRTDMETLETHWYWESQHQLPLHHREDVIYDLELELFCTDPLGIQLTAGGNLLEESSGTLTAQTRRYEFMKYGLPMQVDFDTHVLRIGVKGTRQIFWPIKAQLSYKTVRISEKQKQAISSVISIKIGPTYGVYWDFRISYNLAESCACCTKKVTESFEKDWIPVSIQCGDPIPELREIPTEPEVNYDEAMLTADELAAVLQLV